MSSTGDSSQLSDLSGISGISRSTSLRPATKNDFTFNASECQASSTIREVANTKLTLGVSWVNDKSKIAKLIVSCKEAMSERARMKLLLDCIHSVAASNDGIIVSDTLTKLKELIAVREAKKYLHLPNVEKCSQDDLSLLGIDDLPKINLTLNEKRDINTTIESVFQQKINNFIDSYQKSGGEIREVLKNYDSEGKTSLIESQETETIRWKDPTSEICAEYYRDIVRWADFLNQWQSLKYTEIRELNMKYADNLLLQSQVSEIQANMARNNCASRMFKETSTTVDAFSVLSDEIDGKIADIREKIKKKEILKMSYADVSSNEYDEILKKYTEICSVIRKKENLINIL